MVLVKTRFEWEFSVSRAHKLPCELWNLQPRPKGFSLKNGKSPGDEVVESCKSHYALESSHFSFSQMKAFELSLALKVRVFGTRKWLMFTLRQLCEK